MKTILTSLTILTLAIGYSIAETSKPAAPAAADTGATKMAKPKMIKWSGVVETADATAKALTAKGKDGSSRTFTLGAKCKITKDGKSVTLDTLAKGDNVRVTCTGPEDKPEVQKVMATTHKAPKK